VGDLYPAPRRARGGGGRTRTDTDGHGLARTGVDMKDRLTLAGAFAVILLMDILLWIICRDKWGDLRKASRMEKI